MADMVVPAGIDAARDFDFQLTDVMLQLKRFEMQRDFLRHGNRTRGGQRAIIHAGAGDHI